MFVGPGEARDPCLVRIDGVWFCYYAGYEYAGEAELPGVYARTSTDLVEWSDAQLVHRDRNPAFGGTLWDTECPHVVERDGLYYLFRTENYVLARTHVFWSSDPMDFGRTDASDRYLGTIPVGAPEVIVDRDGTEHITSNHDVDSGTMIAPLDWVPAGDRAATPDRE